MNIALFSDSYLPTKSGVVTVVIQLRNVLEEMGHKVVIVTVGSKEDVSKNDDPCILRVNSIPSPAGDGQFIGLPYRKEVIEFLRKNQIQIIHSHTEFFMGHMANVAGKALNIPVVATTHTMWEDYYKYYLFLGKMIPRKVIRKIVQRVYKKFYAFINVSKKAQDYFNRPFMLPGIPSVIVPNAIDFDRFAAEEFSEESKKQLKTSLGISEKDRVILYVGRVVQEKRLNELLDVIIRVVQKEPSAKMVFVGSGEREEKLRERVNLLNLQDRIIFTGFVEWNKLHGYYSIADLFVTVSLSEMHSMTILEALSLGIPVVCRKDTSFFDTVFHGEDGYFADSDEDMDEYILKLVKNPTLSKQMGQKALEISKRFSLEIHGKRTVAFYEKILEKFPAPVSSAELKEKVDSVIQVM